MATSFPPAFFLLLLFNLLLLLLLPSSPLAAPSAAPASAACSRSHTIAGHNMLLSHCVYLGAQGASLAWSLHSPNGTLDVVFSGTATTPGGWVGWGINPTQLGMSGTQAFIAFQAPNGSTLLTYDVTSGTKDGDPLLCTPISLHVLDMAVDINGTRISMFVSLSLPSSQTNPSTSVLNHVWNRGPPVSNFQPTSHSLANADLSALRAINMSSGTIADVGGSNNLLENAHAILNTIGWGILLPCGVIAARYLKPFADPAWFYGHVTIQVLGYVLGVAGWATGLSLGDNGSGGGDPTMHGNIGIAIFSIATLQMMAIFLRPKKEHKLRKGWNVYHYSLGATVLVLGVINIFEGFEIMAPPEKWRRTYIGILVALGGVAIILEITTWIYVCRRRRYSQGKMHGATVAGTYQFEKGPVS